MAIHQIGYNIHSALPVGNKLKTVVFRCGQKSNCHAVSHIKAHVENTRMKEKCKRKKERLLLERLNKLGSLFPPTSCRMVYMRHIVITELTTAKKPCPKPEQVVINVSQTGWH